MRKSPVALRKEAILKRIEGVKAPVVVEVGVFVGELSKRLLADREDLVLHMVDAWGGNKSDAYKATNDFHASATMEKQREWEKMARKAVIPYCNRAIIHKGLSKDIVKTFSNNMIDLVFIDADHSYEGCKEDIELWKRVVKKGGWLGGHDYMNNEGDFKFGVTEAVDEYIKTSGLTLEQDSNYTWWTKNE